MDGEGLYDFDGVGAWRPLHHQVLDIVYQVVRGFANAHALYRTILRLNIDRAFFELESSVVPMLLFWHPEQMVGRLYARQLQHVLFLAG